MLHLELDSQAIQVTRRIRLVHKPETPEDRFRLSDREKEARVTRLRARFEAASKPSKPQRLRGIRVSLALAALTLAAIWLLAIRPW